MPSAKKITEKLVGLKGCFVAGGAVTSLYTNKPINDFDVYPKSQEALENAISWAYENSLWNSDATDRALTFGKQEDGHVQIMHFDVFPTAAAIFEAFDFTVCMGAFDLDTEQFILHDQFLEHCSQRFIKFNPKTRFPYASAWRVRKYEQKGFTIGKMEFHKILLACAQKPLTSWADLREQVGGVYGESIVIPDSEEFSIEGAIRALDHAEYGKPRTGYSSLASALFGISKTEKAYFQSEKGAFYAWIDGELEKLDCKPLRGKLISVQEAFADARFYKKVLKKDGRYFSHWKPKFEYPMGEEVHSGHPYLYVYSSLSGARGHYSGSGDGHALIELRAAPEDVVFDGGTLRIKRGVVVAEHPQTVEQAA